MLIVGKREVEQRTVSVRLRTGEKLPAMSIDAFIERARGLIKSKAFKEL
jgi:threonyl-tRNA synthetase